MYIESEIVELKRDYTKDIIKEIIAFLNTKGGKVYIGIADNGEVVGIKNIDETMNKLSSAIHDAIRPDAKVFIHINIEEEEIICVDVHEGSAKPYYIQGKGLRPDGVYVRLGTASVPSSETGIKQMLIASTNANYESMPCIKQDLTFEACSRFFRESGLELDETTFRKLNVVDTNGRYTNMSLLLSDQCLHSIKVAVFSGNDVSDFLDRKEFTGSVFSLLRDTLDYLNLNNHLSSKIVDYKRVEKYDYPIEVIREGLLNAIIHRDYAYSGSVLISVYNNRIEMTSLGGLAYGLNFEDITAGISQTRNPGLANIFYRLKYVEAYGTGLRKIRNAYHQYEINEIISVTDNTFKLILRNQSSLNDSKEEKIIRDQPFIYEAMGNNEKMILNYILEHGEINRSLVENLLEVGQTKAGLILKDMTLKKLVYKVGKGKNTVYKQ